MSDDVTLQSYAMTLEQAIEQAVLHHQAGQLQDAERLYRAILEVNPRYSDANHNLGLLAVQMRQPAAGLPYFKAALEENPNQDQFWISYINALQQSGYPDEARALMMKRQAHGFQQPANAQVAQHLQTVPSQQDQEDLFALLEEGRYAESVDSARALTVRFPKHGIGWKFLGIALQKQGRMEPALAALEQAAALLQDDAEVHKSLGGVLIVYGRLLDAEVSYRRALQIKPDYAEVHSNLGIIFKMQGRHSDAEASYRQALKLKPDLVVAYGNLANTFREQGRLSEAEDSYRQALQIKPDYVEGHSNLGALLNNQGRLKEAEASYRRVLELKPNDTDVHSNLGILLYSQGRLTEAEASYRRVLELKPNDIDAHLNLGILLYSQGCLTEAEASYRRVLELRPEDAKAHSNLGGLLMDLGHFVEAEVSCRRAVLLAPELVEAHNNLGGVLLKQGRLDEAEASFRLVVLLNPENAKAHINLGTSLKGLGRLSEAESSYRQALKFEPDSAEVHYCLGNVLNEQGCQAEAKACIERAIQIKPDYADAHNNLGGIFREQGRLLEAEASYRQALAVNSDYLPARTNLLLILNYLASQTPQSCLEEARQYGVMSDQRVTRRYSDWLSSAQSDRLRVGMVSGDLRRHPVGFFLESVLSHIDPARIELIAYSTSHRVDGLTNRIRPRYAAWNSIADISDEDLARNIHADGVQVLIDLSGHTAGNRLPVFSWKPAPVQVTWLGYFATTGMAQMDYLLGDPFVTPVAEAEHFSETVWRLPESYLCFTPPEENVQVQQLPALSGGGITFGCFNHLAKMNNAVVALWAKVLLSVPDSRLFLKTRQLNDAAACASTLQRFAAHGVDAGRIVLEGGSPRLELLQAYQRVDIALDPFPYPGGTTSVEALWMGVPVLTKRGDRFISHVGESIAHNAGLSDWIAADEDQYVAKAVAFAADLVQLASLRAGLRRQVLASPLFDAPRFAHHFEEALWGMWQQWRDTQEERQ